ncbi:hypothetical protein E4U53_005241, partial [Claviceps sorghi]
VLETPWPSKLGHHPPGPRPDIPGPGRPEISQPRRLGEGFVRGGPRGVCRHSRLYIGGAPGVERGDQGWQGGL